MAIELLGYRYSSTAGEDLTDKQFHFIKFSDDNTVILCAAATDLPCGVLQNNPKSGAAAEICAYGITKLVTGVGSVVAGNLVGTDAYGTAIVLDAADDVGAYVAGQVVLGSGDAEVCSAFINCANPPLTNGTL